MSFEETRLERMADEVVKKLRLVEKRTSTTFYEVVKDVMEKFGEHDSDPDTMSYYCSKIGRILGARKKKRAVARY